MRRTLRFVGPLCALFLGACQTSPAEKAEGQPGAAVGAVALGRTATTIPGFNHTTSTTKFQTGGGVSVVVASDRTRWVGSNGTFAVDNANGRAAGVMNAGVPFSPYAGTIAAHEALVQNYFLGAGLPAAQVGGIHTNVIGTGDGVPGPSEVPTQFAFSSVITRAVNGIPVAESHAWARLDAGGGVVAESVYWPALDASVISDAAAIAKTIASPTEAAAYFAKLPVASNAAAAGSVVIHHSSAYVEDTFQEIACFDVWQAASGGSGWTRHFDKNGTEIRLPQELRTASSSERRGQR
jgi:hypothetical protein